MKPILILSLLILCFGCAKHESPVVQIETDKGPILIEVFQLEAPVTATNFLQLVDDGVYTGACFYRVVRMNNQPNNDIKIEVIQGGLKEDSLVERFEPIVHETTARSGVKHLDGVVSMARNEPGSASTEFFICVGDQPELDFGGKRNPDGQGFAAFGRVIEGMDVVKQIQQGNDDGQMLNDEIEIHRIVRIK